MRIVKQVFCATLILMPSVAFADFSDVPTWNPNATAINNLQAQGIIGGYSDGTFQPDQSINRAELMKILVVGALHINPNPPTNNCFSDVHDEWFAPYVCFAYGSKWVQGYEDGTFRPNNTLTEAEALKMIIVSLVPQDSYVSAGCDTSQWYGIFLCQANRLNLLQTSFNASGQMTRGMAAQWIYLALQGKTASSDSQIQTLQQQVQNPDTDFQKKQECQKYLVPLQQEADKSAQEREQTLNKMLLHLYGESLGGLKQSDVFLITRIFYSKKRNSCLYEEADSFIRSTGTVKAYSLIDALTYEIILDSGRSDAPDFQSHLNDYNQQVKTYEGIVP